MESFTKKQLKLLVKREDTLAEFRNTLRSPHAVGLSIDVEAWDVDHKRIKQLGVIAYNKEGVLSSICWVVEENEHLKDRFTKGRVGVFRYGLTYRTSLAKLKHFFWNAYITPLNDDKEVFFIAHNIDSDIRMLEEAGLTNWLRQAATYDSQHLYIAKFHKLQSPTLKKACEEVDIRMHPGDAHNAGNDAWYTAALSLKLANL